MNRPRYSQDRIVELLREAELRLAQGEPLASVCKSLGISRSSYRRWRGEYGERVIENAAAVAAGGRGQTAGVHPAPSKGDFSAKEVKAGLDSKTLALSGEPKERLVAANEASSAARNAWLAFLALLAYLLVTLGGVSHRDLLLNSPVRLPIVNVEIPLFSFFQYAPLLLLLVYLSLLIQHVILTRKYRKFVEAIAPYEIEAQTEHPARELVHSYVVSQILAGPKRNALIRWLMVLMLAVTFAILPLVTLLYFQVTFIPYHEVWITYWHRIAVLLGLAMGLGILPMVHVLPILRVKSKKREVRIGPEDEAWRKSPIGIAFSTVVVILVLGFSWFIATIPDEGIDQLIGFIPPKAAANEARSEVLLNPLVRAGYEPIPEADNPEDRGWLLPWLISYRVLVVEDSDVVPDEGDTHDEVSKVLRHRNLRFARLNRSDLHRADLTEADLRGARMEETRLEKAKLQEAQLQGAELREAQFQGADLSDARLQGANLKEARLQDANLRNAQLQGAILRAVRLQGADLEGIQAQGVDFQYARLQGAGLIKAQLQGADLAFAQLQGAHISGELQGADFRFAELQGATILGELQGADFQYAELQGADLRFAQLQGADLTEARLHGAVLADASIWLARVSDDFANKSPLLLGLTKLNMAPLSADAKAELKQKLQAKITDAKLLGALIERLDPILRDIPPKWEDEATWSRVEEATEPPPDQLVAFWADMACRDLRGHVAASMARRAAFYGGSKWWWPSDYEPYGKPLARALLDDTCQGAKALTDETRAELRELVSRAE